jgi:hypothetical protein
MFANRTTQTTPEYTVAGGASRSANNVRLWPSDGAKRNFARPLLLHRRRRRRQQQQQQQPQQQQRQWTKMLYV